MTPDMQARHRAFLDRFYRLTHHVYDVSRKYFLFGRDGVLKRLLTGDWTALVELGPGTGRNLAWLHRRRPDAMLGGLEASEVMRAHARRRCPWARIDPGFAEDGDIGAILGVPPQRILMSYCLSMFVDKDQAIANALGHLVPGGELWVVDFSDLAGLPAIPRRALRRFLAAFHVEVVPDELLRRHGASRIEHGPLRYFVVARFTARSAKTSDDTACGENAAGDTASDDTACGEKVTGDTASDDTASGEKTTGDTASGDTA
jgi:S-adenosylmethionine-diacylgycerolhomoserine-N-methlytransferase